MNSNQVAKYRFKLRVWQFGLLAAIFFVWWALTKPGLIPAFVGTITIYIIFLLHVAEYNNDTSQAQCQSDNIDYRIYFKPT